MAVAGSLTYDTKIDTKGFSTGLNKVGGLVKGAVKGVTTTIAVATTAIAGLVVSATKAFAEYEQLVGGVDTLFKESSKKLQNYADEAYKTAGLSANEYMATVTSFSASLLQSLEGDTEKSADYANQAVIDMSDNANKMGTSMEMIQNAYQGFAKQNFTMLDNLKLGYGGTKTEMERLIEDANRVKEANGEMADLSVDSFANITEAIHIIQTEMEITGTTAKEASETIEGSLKATQSAWKNLMVGLARGDKDIDKLVDNLIDSISDFAKNVIPIVENAIIGIGDLIEELLPEIVEEIPNILENVIPSLVQSGISMFKAMIDGMKSSMPLIVTSAIEIIKTLTYALLDMLPELLEMGVELIIELAKGLTEEIPTLIPIIIDAVFSLQDAVYDNLDLFIDAGIDLILALALGLIDAIPKLLERIPVIITKVVNALTDPEMIKKLLKAGWEIAKGIFNAIIGFDWLQLGKDIVNGIINGMKNIGTAVWDGVKSVGNSIWNGFKSFFGIASPSKLMKEQIGKFIPEGIAVGITANTDSALRSVKDLNSSIYDEMSKAVNVSQGSLSLSGTAGSVSQILSSNATFDGNFVVEAKVEEGTLFEASQRITRNKTLQTGFGG